MGRFKFMLYKLNVLFFKFSNFYFTFGDFCDFLKFDL